MLTRLRIENLALIGSLEIELAGGLNVVSGETGAGKSVLVDSLALLVGERAGADVVRTGQAAAVVEGLFRLERPELRSSVARLLGEDVDELPLRREVLREGRNRCYVAGRLAPASLLRELGELLVELHGQHEHQLLLKRPAQRDLLDAFGGLEAARLALERGVEAWRADARRLAALRETARARAERLRVLREETEELAGAEIDLEREADRREEAERLRHLQDRRETASRTLAALAGVEGSAEGVLDLLRAARADVRALARDEPRLVSAGERFASVFQELEDLERELGRYLDGLAGDPGRLAELDAREAALLRLTRRYGTDLPGLRVREADARAELAALDSESGRGEELEREVAAAERRLAGMARALSLGRAAAGRELAKSVEANLRDLGVGQGGFEVHLEELPELESGGLERVDFTLAANPGEPPAALRTIASGGELSRVTLALKAALADADRVPTLVFDEVDVGLGGRAAHRVAAKLAELGKRRQVIAITHLATIAAAASLHLRVEKVVRGGRSLTTVSALSAEEHVQELSRMLGGEPGSESSLRYARELAESGGRGPGAGKAGD